MATGKSKGVVGAATDRLQEATGALRGEGPWHSVNLDVYHNNPNYPAGNSMGPDNVQQGTGNCTHARQTIPCKADAEGEPTVMPDSEW